MKNRKKPARWKYLLNALVLIAPAWYFYDSMTPPEQPAALPERELAGITAAPRPTDTDPPYRHEGRYLKDFSVAFCEGCAERIRTAYLSVSDSPPALPEDGFGVIHGHGATKHVHAPYPSEPRDGHRLWLTVQTWDGEIHRVSWPLANQG